MATPKKRRKILIFSVIGLALISLTAGAILKKREVIVTIQTEKVARRNLTEIVVANGKIQPVVLVKISPEVSGEIIELPVKEGQVIKKGDLLLKIRPDFYEANRNQADASYKSSLASLSTAEANMRKAQAEWKRSQDLFKNKLVSDSSYDEIRAANEVAAAQVESSKHQVEMSKASLASADEQLAKTTIVSPLSGTVTKLNSQLGERVLGTVQNVGTEIMSIADLNEMEARVDVGEIDVVLIEPGQHVRLEVDAFKDRKFNGTVTEVANSSGGAGGLSSVNSSSSQEATKFGVKIRIKEKEPFRPGMSVTAEIETRSRTNVLTVPIASVTTRMPKKKGGTNEVAQTNRSASSSSAMAAEVKTNAEPAKSDKKGKDVVKPVEVVFLAEGERAKMAPVKIGISDDNYWEVTEGLQEGQEVVSGGYRAISRDLEDGKKIKKGTVAPKDGMKENEEKER